MERPETEPGTTFSQPIRAITTMLLVSVLVALGAWAIHGAVIEIIWTNPVLNGLITFVFLIGIATCFWQVFILAQSVSWIEAIVRHKPGAETVAPPRLLAPLASLLRSRKAARLTIPSSAARSILESVAQRIDEARDITRYLINLLVFLGLLGTFWGLATTVPAVVETIRSLAPAEGESGLDVFGKLMGGLESQLGGMGTAFSSSLLGLAGSLVVGLLELFAGHGQNRFYRELEEWLSSITRIGLGSEGEGDQSGVALVLDQMAGQMESLQELYLQSDAARAGMEDKLAGLAAAINGLGAGRAAAEALAAEHGAALTAAVERLARLAETEQARAAEQNATLAALVAKLAAGQDQLVQATQASADNVDAESRMRLRSIDTQLLRILEELSAGRQESVSDLRSDIAGLTAAIRHLGRSPMGRS
ncbi:biopolymer transporter ExbB [Xinfangfangia sp. CPCC 101601]|uniref:Biopolymer transporter ExbB n=1 Tax=Pseudogemmobacter lacusdianii TaxID=3069608 RepID=A0ABU0W077_9RHOB|nr:biopolymer transporter ExbB [Xinfangfangia sp. CPCC 101601]MDQ2067401.1 biopolymer transporter ExbB [Xinfangfangia sp. CPCC 101601]